MKQIYLVGTSKYNVKYVMAYENRNDAVRSACALNECDASEAADYIKALPFMYEQPRNVDITDVQTVIDMTIKAYESVSRSKQEVD